MKKQRKTSRSKFEASQFASDAAFWVSVSLLVVVPIVFSRWVNAIYALPKFAVLLTGSSVLVFLLIRMALKPSRNEMWGRIVKSRYAKVICLYFVAIAISTIFGVAPLVSLFGNNSNFMGLMARLCFLVCFISLIASIGASEKRLLTTLWAMALAGGLVATYAFSQFFGLDPFVSSSVYTFDSDGAKIVRVGSSIGHADHLGNFLLYTTPLSLGLAFASRGGARLIASAATLLSIAAIACSGTRGAWLGIIVGIGAMALLELKVETAKRILANKRQLIRVVAFACVLLAATVLIAFSPSSRSIIERAKLMMTEGASSSGRLLLWSDSIKMIPRFAIVGCGPEGFRKAFPVYKSEQLAQLSPRANNESPHNAYLETAISYGLPGAAVYVLIIAYAMALMLRARRHARSQNWRIITTGLLASFLAVLSHNIFIFDQISTGLYFFALLAVAFVLPEIAGQRASQDKAGPRIQAAPAAAGQQAERGSNTRPRWQEIAITAPTCVLVVAAAWFSISLLKVEMAYTKLFNPSRPPDYQAILLQEERITNNPLPTGAYDFLYARALNLFAQQISNPASSAAKSAARGGDLGAIRTEALRLAISHTEKSLAHTNTPDWNYSFLASLALATGDTEKLRWAAAEAVKWDPGNYYARWLMAEAYIAGGERELAKREAEAALKLYPPSPEAASALARASGQISSDDVAGIMARARNTRLNLHRGAEELIEIARGLSEAGKLQKARTKLFVAIGRAGGRCANCHRELAIVYERMGRYSEAITEWGSFSQESPDTASAEQAKARIAELQAKMAKP